MKKVANDKKYELTDETIEHNGHTLHRIRALRNFGSVRSGDWGGFVESEFNLSHEGDCWIGSNAKVYGNGRVQQYARVRHLAEVYDRATIAGEAIVDYNAKVYGNAVITDEAHVTDYAEVYESAFVSDRAYVSDHAQVLGSASLFGSVCVYDCAIVCKIARLYGTAKVCGQANISGGSIHGCAYIGGCAIISDTSDYIVFKNWWSSGRYFTWTRSNNMWRVGCFYGTGEELIKKAYKDSEESGREYERVVNYVNSILKDEKRKA